MGENTSLGEKFGRGKGKKSNTRKNYGSETNSIAKKGQGALPLAESRGSASGGVWGNAPTAPRQTYSKGKVNKAQAAKRPCQ